MSPKMSSKTRLMTAIHHQEPDLVPNAPRIHAYLLEYYGSSSWTDLLKAAVEFDFDPVIVLSLPVSNYLYSPFGDYKDLEDIEVDLTIQRHSGFTEISRTIKTPKGTLTDCMKWGQSGKEGYGISPNPERVEYLIKTPEDVDRIVYLLPDPKRVKFTNYAEIAKIVGERGLLEVRPHCGVDHMMVDSVGLTNLMYLYYDDRETFRRLLKLYHNYYKELIKRSLESGAEVIFDSWYNFSLSAGWSPRIVREEIFPLIKEDVDLVHNHGALHHYYDDGKVMLVLQDIKNTGTDILSTLCPPPVGDVDLAEAKSQVGDTVCLKGNIDLLYVILKGTSQIIREAVKEAIAVAAPGGGFILSTSDSIRDGTPLENVKAYFQAAREFGKYPIKG